ncbi:cystathionine beta-synthase [Enteractinococcus fodinae]|uniref:Cystathionine beta-synthase n=1 Tax=Enteractinococcus fodinae TaxID=684663 RepID=A0ABU2AYF6_9MICC|nr:pyridoxal-phosphate dependent enzyme [Enteractinococcus fodinae]MDR7346387.1 cystathionine beta-synthase [Enteractinococcus fodinae]
MSQNQPTSVTPKYAETILDLIGNTPLVKLNSIGADLKPTILVKCEFLNPGGSIKDRIALKMIERAEAEGKLSEGGTVVEPTSGNTGVGLAMVAQQKGYRSVFITPSKVAQEKRDVLKAYGADVVVSETAVPPESENSYYGITNRLEEAIEGAYQPNQFFNSAAPESHYETTGPEIWEDTAGQVTHVVIGAGTGGTMTGTGRYLHEVSADRESGPVKVVVADPSGSVYSGGSGRPYFVEGVGEDMWPGNYDPEVPDSIHEITDAEAFHYTRRLAAEEGILAGGSSGMALAAALKEAENLTEDDVMVVILPDSGRGYLGKIFSETWMEEHGFDTNAPEPVAPQRIGTAYLDGTDPAAPEADTDTVEVPGLAAQIGDLLDTKAQWLPGSLPEVVVAVLDAPVSDAISTMNRYGIDALPVVGGIQEAYRIGEVRGAVTVRALMDQLASGAITADSSLAETKLTELPKVGYMTSVADTKTVLETAPAALVTRDGNIAGIISAHDILMHLIAK